MIYLHIAEENAIKLILITVNILEMMTSARNEKCCFDLALVVNNTESLPRPGVACWTAVVRRGYYSHHD